jgi:hypothetical protein
MGSMPFLLTKKMAQKRETEEESNRAIVNTGGMNI